MSNKTNLRLLVDRVVAGWSDSPEEFQFILRVPTKSKRHNPYAEEESPGMYTTVCGLIDKRMGEYGFSHVIDMDYKSKDDQFSSIFLQCAPFMTEQEFIQICKKNKMDVIYYNSGQ